jgi:hypothetical protein
MVYFYTPYTYVYIIYSIATLCQDVISSHYMHITYTAPQRAITLYRIVCILKYLHYSRVSAMITSRSIEYPKVELN